MHYTVANWLFDTVMPDKDANGSAFKVVSAVARMTAGWSRQWTENPLSFTDFENLTGMARDSVANGLKDALEKGYIKRQKSGRSFVYSLAVKVPNRSDNPTSDSPENRLQTPEQSENPTDKQLDNPTDNSPEIQPITGDTIKEKEKKNIYTNGYRVEISPDAYPYPDIEEKRQEMVTAIAVEVKTTLHGGNIDEFRQVADGILGKGFEPEQVKGFYVNHWKKHGHYPGKPALKSLSDEIDNYVNGQAESASSWMDDIVLDYRDTT